MKHTKKANMNILTHWTTPVDKPNGRGFWERHSIPHDIRPVSWCCNINRPRFCCAVSFLHLAGGSSSKVCFRFGIVVVKTLFPRFHDWYFPAFSDLHFSFISHLVNWMISSCITSKKCMIWYRICVKCVKTYPFQHCKYSPLCNVREIYNA